MCFSGNCAATARLHVYFLYADVTHIQLQPEIDWDTFRISMFQSVKVSLFCIVASQLITIGITDPEGSFKGASYEMGIASQRLTTWPIYMVSFTCGNAFIPKHIYIHIRKILSA